jgi:site-specific DNA-methyltransferase (adenine-specific)
MEYGSGALNVDGGRVGVLAGDRTEYGRGRELPHANTTVSLGKFSKVTPYSRPDAGRYPANLVLDEESAEMLDGLVGDRPTQRIEKPCPEPIIRGHKWGTMQQQRGPRGYDGSGGPSRFFYCAKASRSERGKANDHPTVQPIALTKWLATLLLPPDSVKPRRLLVPFAGSGSEMIGALEASWDEVIGIEKEESYCRLASRRLKER